MRVPSLLDSVIIILVGLFVERVLALIILAWFARFIIIIMMSFADLGCHSCGVICYLLRNSHIVKEGLLLIFFG